VDERLSWNAAEVDNVTSIYVASEDMWVPDVALLNK